MDAAQLIANALRCEPPDCPLYEGLDTYCAVTGVPISRGYAVSDVAPDALNNLHEVFAHSTAYVSEAAAAVLANDWNMGSRVCMEDGTMFHPLVNPENAEKQARPCWRDVVAALKTCRQKLVVIFNSDFKKRVWHLARSGYVGDQMPLCLHDAPLGIRQTVVINYSVFVEALSLVQHCRAEGFSRVVDGRAYGMIDRLLYDMAAVERVGIPKALKLDKLLQPFRVQHYYELAFASLVEGYTLK